MITKYICGSQKEPIFVGRRGENLATQIYFDVPKDLSEYTYTLYVRRPKEIDSYPAAYIAKDGNYIVWTVSNVDTANSGQGQVQIRFTDGDVVVKTLVYSIKVGIAIDINTSPTPEWQTTWLDALTELSEATHANAEAAAESEANAKASEDNAKASEQAAAESATQAHTSEENAQASEREAKASEDNAKTSEENAAESAETAAHYAEISADAGGFAFFSVDDNTGELIANVTDKLNDDLTFAINKNNGTLEVTVL